MHHEVLHSLEQLWVFSTAELVDIVTGVWLEAFLENQKHVAARKATLLEFDHHHVGCHFSENVLLEEILAEFLEFRLEDSGGEIWTVLRRLARQERFDFSPLRIARNGEEDVWLPMASHDCHRVLIALLHVS